MSDRSEKRLARRLQDEFNGLAYSTALHFIRQAKIDQAQIDKAQKEHPDLPRHELHLIVAQLYVDPSRLDP